MLQKKIYVFIIFIVSQFIITSCKNELKNIKKSTNKSETGGALIVNPLFDRELELLEVLDHYQIPTNESLIVLMPPSKCSSCKLGALKALDTLQNVYILIGDSGSFKQKNTSQKLVYYDPQLINRKGLVKLYSAIIKIKNRKIINYDALLN